MNLPSQNKPLAAFDVSMGYCEIYFKITIRRVAVKELVSTR